MTDDEAPPLPSEFAQQIAEDVELTDGEATRKLLAIISDQLDTLIGLVAHALPEDDDDAARMH